MAKGACVVKGSVHGEGAGCVWQKGGHAWYAPPHERPLVIARAVRILLECILVMGLNSTARI